MLTFVGFSESLIPSSRGCSRPAVRMTAGQSSRNELLSAALASAVALQLAMPLPADAYDYDKYIKRPPPAETALIAPPH